MTKGVFSETELSRRLRGLQGSVQELGLDGALILQRADLVYFTGAAFQGALAMPTNGNPILFTWRGAGWLPENLPVETVPVRGMGKLADAMKQAGFGSWKRIGFEEDSLPVAHHKMLLNAIWDGGESIDISSKIRYQRAVKSEEELEQVRYSGKILATGFESLRDILQEGVYEYEAQALMDVAMRVAGDQSMTRTRAFNAEARGVVACGASAAATTAFDGPIGQPGRNPLAPMGAGGNPIVKNAPIIADHTAGYNGYMTDMTRTYYIGEIDQRFVDAHNFCVEIHKSVLRQMVPGAIPAEIYAWAVAEAEKAGYGDNFMNRGDNRVRFLGHGVGIEMDEWPVLAKPFKEPLISGMVLAVEPKIIFEDGGVGVEDTVVVLPDAAEVVTPMEYGLIQVG
ncbi:Xaa-Pro peptidase family protein [bacterium]|nr:Xaa-Pro peptidase family protein [bacterium]